MFVQTYYYHYYSYVTLSSYLLKNLEKTPCFKFIKLLYFESYFITSNLKSFNAAAFITLLILNKPDGLNITISIC